jgi:hypothetical protein
MRNVYGALNLHQFSFGEGGNFDTVISSIFHFRCSFCISGAGSRCKIHALSFTFLYMSTFVFALILSTRISVLSAKYFTIPYRAFQ